MSEEKKKWLIEVDSETTHLISLAMSQFHPISCWQSPSDFCKTPQPLQQFTHVWRCRIMPADPNFPLSEKFVVPATDRFPNARQLNYFTSCDPHHDIYTFSYWQIFWHSIWHIFWHSIWHIFWHMFWHIFWHSIWHIFWHMFWHIFWHSIWHIFWPSIWHIFWHSIWHIFWHSIWHSIWHIFWHSIWPLRSGSAHWDLELAVEARQCPLRPGSRSWGPAVPTCNSRLRSGSAHWDLELGWRSGCAHWDLELAVEVRLSLTWQLGKNTEK